MAEARELDVVIDIETGEVTMDAIGFTGRACEELNDQIAAALGGVQVSVKTKPERDALVIQADGGKIRNFVKSGRW